jgi:hypothetical protein
VHAVTRDRAAAQRRRDYHQGLIAGAPGWRAQVWKAAGWIISELRLASESSRASIIAVLAGVADDLNVQNGGSRDYR